MLAVFLGGGYLVRRSINYRPRSVLALGLGLIVVTVIVEALHEGLHKLVFGVGGVSAEIEWTELATIPHEQEVSVKFVVAALVMPGIVLTGLLLVGGYVSSGPLVTAIIGYGVVLNVTLSVVDAFSLATIAGESLQSRIYFESTPGGTQISVSPSPGATK